MNHYFYSGFYRLGAFETFYFYGHVSIPENCDWAVEWKPMIELIAAEQAPPVPSGARIVLTAFNKI